VAKGYSNAGIMAMYGELALSDDQTRIQVLPVLPAMTKMFSVSEAQQRDEIRRSRRLRIAPRAL